MNTVKSETVKHCNRFVIVRFWLETMPDEQRKQAVVRTRDTAGSARWWPKGERS
ncbi:MAG: hypothetical protein G8237_09640 [Magnetococcales bacterium]|nr:hypothetical protein [Magnetococcales bacterium]NGZ06607.1 hypothetical protein [Magnetococcales bacterium]